MLYVSKSEAYEHGNPCSGNRVESAGIIGQA